MSGCGLEPPKGSQCRLALGRLYAVPLFTDSKQTMEGHPGESPCALTAPKVCCFVLAAFGWDHLCYEHIKVGWLLGLKLWQLSLGR